MKKAIAFINIIATISIAVFLMQLFAPTTQYSRWDSLKILPPAAKQQEITKRVGDDGIPAGTSLAVVETKDSLHFSRCTAGFTITDVNGDLWTITAGHCGTIGNLVYVHENIDQPLPEQPVGTITLSGITSQSDSEQPDYDWAAIKLDKNAPLDHVMSTPSGVPTIVSFTTSGEIGSQVCKWGATTHNTCGVIVRNDVSINASGGNHSQLFTRTTEVVMCSRQGDSGAPIYNNSAIIGVLSSTTVGDDGQCNPESKTEYTPTGIIITAMNQAHPGLFNIGSDNGTN